MDEPPLARDAIESLMERVGRREEPDPGSAFLADAHFGAFCAFPRDLNRAVLLSAFACEIRLRDMLRTHLRPAASSQFHEWFPDQGRAKRPLATWPGPVAKELAGRFLEDEDRVLYEQFGQMVALRNQLAHRGVPPDLDGALDSVRTAR